MITVEHLTKRYGEFTAVSDLSFEIEEEHVRVSDRTVRENPRQ